MSHIEFKFHMLFGIPNLFPVRACGLSIAICTERPLTQLRVSRSESESLSIPNLNSLLQRGFKEEKIVIPSRRLRPF
jgi:hypothetical protein